jgi:predicted RNase H-like HicB family nuclease
MKLTYPAIFYEHEDCFVVVVPDLPGCSSWGETLAEAIFMGIDAASGWVLSEFENGKPAPKSSSIKDIHPDEDIECISNFTSILLLDMDDYAQKYGNQAACNS